MRVPLDFDWPLGEVWVGYINPFEKYRSGCPACGGSGHNRETREIEEQFYAGGDEHARWCDKITQDEVDALIEKNRIWDFWREIDPFTGRWVDRDPKPYVTAEMVNEAQRSRRGFLVHDSINRWILVETRAKRLGVWGECHVCEGLGDIWPSKWMHDAWDNWEPTMEPPEGEGWQVWETVSDGSPVSPVFATSDQLIEWMMTTGGHSRKAAEAFIEQKYAPSMIISGNRVAVGIDSLDMD